MILSVRNTPEFPEKTLPANVTTGRAESGKADPEHEFSIWSRLQAGSRGVIPENGADVIIVMESVDLGSLWCNQQLRGKKMTEHKGFRIVPAAVFYDLEILPRQDFLDNPARIEFVVTDGNGNKIDDGFDAVDEAKEFIENLIAGRLIREPRT